MQLEAFDHWVQEQVATLNKERDAVIAKRDSLLSRVVPTSIPEAQELLSLLKEFFGRYRCVEGTFELNRWRSDGQWKTEAVLYGVHADGQPDTFFDFKAEPFWTRTLQLLAPRDRDCRLAVRLDLVRGDTSVQLLEGEALDSRREVGGAEAALRHLERRLGRYTLRKVGREPFGVELARAVADALKRADLLYSHRDYCGTGLVRREDGAYEYVTAYDGGPSDVLETFAGAEPFVAWLAQQSDASLSRFGEDEFLFLNQTIHRERLEEFVRGASPDRK